MKSQSLKLFAMAFVLGLTAVFATVSASAQSKLFFETRFDFQVGNGKLQAGKYELLKMGYGKYILKNIETENSRIVLFDITLSNKNEASEERVIFNRYGETYFLSSVFARAGVPGQKMFESKYEKQVRKSAAGNQNQLAEDRAQPERVSVKISK